MSRPKGSLNKKPVKVRKNLNLSQEMIAWLDRQPDGFTRTVEKLIEDKMAQKIEHKHHTYALQEDATLSNRVFPGWFGDAKEGGIYTAEYQAKALDWAGFPFLVVWQFEVIRGQEPEDEGEYNWGDVYDVRPQ